MKLASIAAFAAAASLCGCASVPRATTVAEDNVDQVRVATVDRVARTRGVTVVWINLPTKRATTVGVAPAMADPAKS